MINKKLILGTSSALVLGLLAGTYLLSGLNKASLASTTTFGRGKPAGVERNCTDADYQAIQKAIVEKDYATWKELRQKYASTRSAGGSQWDKLIDSESKFEKFVDMKNYMDQGEYEKAWQIKNELGFQKGMGQGLGRGQHRAN